MGFSPQQIDQMSIWQFFAALDGWLVANSASDGLSETEKEEIWDWLQTRSPVPASHKVH